MLVNVRQKYDIYSCCFHRKNGGFVGEYKLDVPNMANRLACVHTDYVRVVRGVAQQEHNTVSCFEDAVTITVAPSSLIVFIKSGVLVGSSKQATIEDLLFD